MRQDSTKQHKL